VHGLSGSAELMLLVLATIRQPVWALIYVGIFGLGMMSAMFALTALFSVVFNWTHQKQYGLWQQFHGGLCVLTGVASAGLGLRLLWVW
jgi:high-affinity nickel-transport protein